MKYAGIDRESGDYLSSGVLIETADIGMIHYAEPDETIIFTG